jgi:hypothetical protein
MASDETCTWTGATGTKYTYYVYPRGTSVTEGQNGNYVYAKKTADGKSWLPVYFGEGDLSDRAGKNHHQSGCIDSKKATHVHMHLNATKDARREEEKDLLARYTNALEPTGCNVSPTG